ncbi:hypothetical protein RB195_026492 [Necator americanus]|uniref:Mos1 transposase HTH domain-containing protein n=1 Tax=Necator americanus TaxID=51031 RepID=A0ABR1EWU3_NECAM
MSITQEQLRAIIFYEWRGGIGATEAARDINSRLNDGTAAIRTVQRWFARIVNGGTDFKDNSRSGRTYTVEDSVILDAVENYWEINSRSLATRFGCSCSTVVCRLQAFGYRKVLARWIPLEILSIDSSSSIERSFSEIFLLEIRIGSSTTLKRTVLCGFLEEKTR